MVRETAQAGPGRREAPRPAVCFRFDRIISMYLIDRMPLRPAGAPPRRRPDGTRVPMSDSEPPPGPSSGTPPGPPAAGFDLKASSELLKAMGHKDRLQILMLLAQGERTVAEL